MRVISKRPPRSISGRVCPADGGAPRGAPQLRRRRENRRSVPGCALVRVARPPAKGRAARRAGPPPQRRFLPGRVGRPGDWNGSHHVGLRAAEHDRAPAVALRSIRTGSSSSSTRHPVWIWTKSGCRAACTSTIRNTRGPSSPLASTPRTCPEPSRARSWHRASPGDVCRRGLVPGPAREPALGRLFTEEDGRPGFMNMRWTIPVLLAHDFWVGHFGRDPDVVGRILTINDNPRKVVGVLPEGFAFPDRHTQIWMLLEPPRVTSNFARVFNWNAVARLRPGVDGRLCASRARAHPAAGSWASTKMPRRRGSPKSGSHRS